MNIDAARNDLKRIFTAGLRRVDPYRMIKHHVRLSGSRLMVTAGEDRHSVNLEDFDRIMVLGAGKATAPMARAMEDILGDRIHAGLIVVKYGHTVPLDIVETAEAGHPVPDENGVVAARRLMEMAGQADDKTLVISLISGGGSALLPLPLEGRFSQETVSLTLEDKQQTTCALLACGARIEEINCIRKHLSGVKGGRLLARLAPAKSLNFILSDVVGDDLSSIASGITAPDPTTYPDALSVIRKYGIAGKIPEAVMNTLRMGDDGVIPETLKPGDPAAAAVNILIGTNKSALNAAAREAEALGYRPMRLTARITGEAREAARMLAAIAVDAAADGMLVSGPACILSGGEPVVTLRGDGKGGRNQEMALAFLKELAMHADVRHRICFLSGATDGNDGPTDAAGAFADTAVLENAAQLALDIDDHLNRNDAYPFFEKTGGLLKTGPTNTNVCDLHLILIAEE